MYIYIYVYHYIILYIIIWTDDLNWPAGMFSDVLKSPEKYGPWIEVHLLPSSIQFLEVLKVKTKSRFTVPPGVSNWFEEKQIHESTLWLFVT